MFNNLPFPEDALGVVDRTADHFEYVDDRENARPSDARVLARMCGTNEQPVVELEPGPDAALLRATRGEIATCLGTGSDRTFVGFVDARGVMRRAPRDSLEMTCWMTWNLYGDCRWQGVRGK